MIHTAAEFGQRIAQARRDLGLTQRDLALAIGIAGGKDCAMLFVRGQQVRMLRGNIVDELCEEIERLVLE